MPRRHVIQDIINNAQIFSKIIFKDNSTMNKTEAQIVSHGILYLKCSSYITASDLVVPTARDRLLTV